VIWGLSDPATLPGCLRGLEEYVEKLTIVRIEDAGHYPMRSHATAVTKAINDFVR
jgi:pimeloyl-ACP methyl ester carboxylesterase